MGLWGKLHTFASEHPIITAATIGGGLVLGYAMSLIGYSDTVISQRTSSKIPLSHSKTWKNWQVGTTLSRKKMLRHLLG